MAPIFRSALMWKRRQQKFLSILMYKHANKAVHICDAIMFKDKVYFCCRFRMDLWIAKSNVVFRQCGGKIKRNRELQGQKKIHVSLGMGEMKWELREWNERKVQCRMTIIGREQQTVNEKIGEGWTRHHPVPAPLAKQRPWCWAGSGVRHFQAERKWPGSPGFGRAACPVVAASR